MLLIMLLGMLGLMFFMQSRAKKQQATQAQFRSNLQPGQRVMTQGGLIGTIVSINEAEDSVVLESAGSLCEYMRAGISKTLEPASGFAVAPAVSAIPVGTPVTVLEPAAGTTVETITEATVAGAEPIAAYTGGETASDFDVLDQLAAEYQQGNVEQNPEFTTGFDTSL